MVKKHMHYWEQVNIALKRYTERMLGSYCSDFRYESNGMSVLGWVIYIFKPTRIEHFTRTLINSDPKK